MAAQHRAGHFRNVPRRAQGSGVGSRSLPPGGGSCPSVAGCWCPSPVLSLLSTGRVPGLGRYCKFEVWGTFLIQAEAKRVRNSRCPSPTGLIAGHPSSPYPCHRCFRRASRPPSALGLARGHSPRYVCALSSPHVSSGSARPRLLLGVGEAQPSSVRPQDAAGPRARPGARPAAGPCALARWLPAGSPGGRASARGPLLALCTGGRRLELCAGVRRAGRGCGQPAAERTAFWDLPAFREAALSSQ